MATGVSDEICLPMSKLKYCDWGNVLRCMEVWKVAEFNEKQSEVIGAADRPI